MVDELPLFIWLIILKTSAVAVRIYQHPVLLPWSSKIKKKKDEVHKKGFPLSAHVMNTFGPQVNALYFDAFMFYSSISLLVLYTWDYDSRYRSLPFPVFQFLLCGFLFIGTQVGAAVTSLSCRSRLISHSFGRLESFLTNTLHLPSLLMCRSNDFAYLTLDFSGFHLPVLCPVAFTFCACRHSEISRGL